METGPLACEFPSCLLHTCLLCPQPRTQLSQPRATYPHMNGSAAFPPWALWWRKHLSLLAPREDVDPFLESTPVSVTHSCSFGKLLISKRSLEEVVGTNGRLLRSLNTWWHLECLLKAGHCRVLGSCVLLFSWLGQSI